MSWNSSVLDDNIPNICCPVCGYEFDEPKDNDNVCQRLHGPFKREELIGTWDDYEFVY